jgi:hypothetical protein
MTLSYYLEFDKRLAAIAALAVLANRDAVCLDSKTHEKALDVFVGGSVGKPSSAFCIRICSSAPVKQVKGVPAHSDDAAVVEVVVGVTSVSARTELAGGGVCRTSAACSAYVCIRQHMSACVCIRTVVPAGPAPAGNA